MNLTGNWKGQYTYGKGYPEMLKRKSEPFEFTIIDKDGTISGECIDEITKRIEGNESYIIGTFIDKKIQFKKRYKFHYAIDENGNPVVNYGVKIDGVDYKGRLRKKLFSNTFYFSGKWSITHEFNDENGIPRTIIGYGTWKMNRVK